MSDAVPAPHPHERPAGSSKGPPGAEPDPHGKDFLDRPATPEIVREAFWLILGRAPAEADLQALRHVKNAGEVRRTLLRSEEFRRRLPEVSDVRGLSAAHIDAVKTIFMHIPKTGGITMHALLKPHFERVFPERLGGLHYYTAGELAWFQLFSGHFSYKSCELIPGPKRIFTMLRRPVDRLISKYNFARAHSEGIVRQTRMPLAHLARRHRMREFFSLEEVRRHPSVDNAMVRTLSMFGPAGETEAGEEDPITSGALETAKRNLRSLLAFGILEHYAESVELIFTALGLPVPATIERKNVLSEIAGKVKGLDLMEPQVCGPETLELIAPLVEADTALYDYGLELFQENIAALHRKRKGPPGMKSMEEIPWRHQVPLGDGRITPGAVSTYKFEKRKLFDQVDFRGKSVLDIGAWDGYFSFAAERNGASRVVALDDADFRTGGMDGFNFLHDHFKSSVQWTKGNIYRMTEEMFDVVLCYGVLYHLSDLLLAVTNCFHRSNDLVIFEGLMFESEQPLLRLLEPCVGTGGAITNDTSPYTMSTGYLARMARLNGFELVKHLQQTPFRGAMMFKLVARTPSPYRPTCFPIAPVTASSVIG